MAQGWLRDGSEIKIKWIVIKTPTKKGLHTGSLDKW
jgi:hypothetical protein